MIIEEFRSCYLYQKKKKDSYFSTYIHLWFQVFNIGKQMYRAQQSQFST